MPQLRLGMEVMAVDTEDMEDMEDMVAMEAIEAMERGPQKLKLMLSQDISEVDMAVMVDMVAMDMEDMVAMDVEDMDMARGLLMLRP